MFGKKKKGDRWPALLCTAGDLIAVIQDDVSIGAPINEFIFRVQDEVHTVGVSADYDGRRGFFDLLFYLDKQEYPTMEEFLEKASLQGRRFAQLGVVSVLEDKYCGNPRGNPRLAACGSRPPEET